MAILCWAAKNCHRGTRLFLASMPFLTFLPFQESPLILANLLQLTSIRTQMTKSPTAILLIIIFAIGYRNIELSEYRTIGPANLRSIEPQIVQFYKYISNNNLPAIIIKYSHCHLICYSIYYQWVCYPQQCSYKRDYDVFVLFVICNHVT